MYMLVWSNLPEVDLGRQRLRKTFLTIDCWRLYLDGFAYPPNLSPLWRKLSSIVEGVEKNERLSFSTDCLLYDFCLLCLKVLLTNYANEENLCQGSRAEFDGKSMIVIIPVRSASLPLLFRSIFWDAAAQRDACADETDCDYSWDSGVTEVIPRQRMARKSNY